MSKGILLNLAFLLTFVSTSSFGMEAMVGTVTVSTEKNLNQLAQEYEKQIPNVQFQSSFEKLSRHPLSFDQLSELLELDSSAHRMLLLGENLKAIKLLQQLKTHLEKIPNVSGIEKIRLSTEESLAEIKTKLRQKDADVAWKEASFWLPKNESGKESEFSASALFKMKSVLLGAPVKVSFSGLQENSLAEFALYIDGKRIKDLAAEPTGKPSLKIQTGNHQFALLRPGHDWSVLTKTISKGANDIEFPLTPLASGTCKNPRISNPKTEGTLVIQFEDHCARVFKYHEWYTLEGVRLTSNLGVVSAAGIASDGLVLSENLPEPKRKFLDELVQSKWFWISAGTVLAGLAIISSQNQGVTPTHVTQ